ncbi:hypothetical protein GC097_24790 [Paenibacillus sp. LMG 31457]|uniref:Uncharacterized protein n=1 Tax=Paenibacillus planticolens TaxID=2654976 RepID=A0ABX1ZT35_9BACL|nr:PsbP-related protein [Paenibacillus planticolens]NOV03222.1 hypothetical protein [Paenibacillus planticolens]
MQFFGVISEPKGSYSDGFNVSDYTELIIEQMNEAEVIENLKVISQKELTIDGHPAREVQITGLIGKINAVYLLTFVETKTSFYQLNFWTGAKSIEDIQADLTKIASTFKELRK